MSLLLLFVSGSCVFLQRGPLDNITILRRAIITVFISRNNKKCEIEGRGHLLLAVCSLVTRKELKGWSVDVSAIPAPVGVCTGNLSR